MKRNIKYIVVHCTATQPDATIDAIKHYWKEKLGWHNNGYHYIIKRDGVVENITHEAMIANGVAGFNTASIHLSYIGGVDKNNKPIDNRTDAQKEAMFNLIVNLSHKYPQAEIKGHRDFPNVHKDCPSFDVKNWLKNYEPAILQAA
jgi:N-acetylmuramoyl-L-alanine amidase